MTTKKITINELRTLIDQIIKEDTANIKYLNTAKFIYNKIKNLFSDVEIVYKGKSKNLARVSFSIDNVDYESTFYCGETNIGDDKFFCQVYNSDEGGEYNTEFFKTINELLLYINNIEK